MAVDDGGLAAVVLSPPVPHRQPELVGLAVGVAVQREVSHPARRAPVIPLGKACVGDHQTAAVEHVVTDETVDELGNSFGELGAAPLELFERLGQPVADRDVASREGPTQLVLMVARDAQRTARSHHGHGDVEHFGDGGAPVDEIAEKDRPATLGMRDRVRRGVIAQPVEQTQQLNMAAVDIADDVEWAGVVAAVAPDPGASHLH